MVYELLGKGFYVFLMKSKLFCFVNYHLCLNRAIVFNQLDSSVICLNCFIVIPLVLKDKRKVCICSSKTR